MTQPCEHDISHKFKNMFDNWSFETKINTGMLTQLCPHGHQQLCTHESLFWPFGAMMDHAVVPLEHQRISLLKESTFLQTNNNKVCKEQPCVHAMLTVNPRQLFGMTHLLSKCVKKSPTTHNHNIFFSDPLPLLAIYQSTTAAKKLHAGLAVSSRKKLLAPKDSVPFPTVMNVRRTRCTWLSSAGRSHTSGRISSTGIFLDQSWKVTWGAFST